MTMYQWIDPFIWQLLIVPVLTIGVGVFVALRTEKAYIAPLVTLVLNVGIELVMGFLYDPYVFLLSSWNFILPFISFVLAFTFVEKRKTERQLD